MQKMVEIFVNLLLGPFASVYLSLKRRLYRNKTKSPTKKAIKAKGIKQRQDEAKAQRLKIIDILASLIYATLFGSGRGCFSFARALNLSL